MLNTNKNMVLNDKTPEEYKCPIGGCPTILERTPDKYKCGILGGCPAAFEQKKTYLIIGTQLNPQKYKLTNRVGDGEVLIEIPKGLLEDIIEERVEEKLLNLKK